MKPGNFKVKYDGTILSATIKAQPTLALKISLFLLNFLLIAIIILFIVGGIGVIVLFIIAFELLFLRYSIWNLYGAECVTLNKDTLSHQQFYSYFKLPVKTFKINKSIRVIPFHENFQAKNKTMKLIFESYDDENEPVNLYQTALGITQEDYALFIKSFNQLYPY